MAKTCPFCAERIQDAAVLCRYCGRDQPPVQSSPVVATDASSQVVRPSPFGTALLFSWAVLSAVGTLLALCGVVLSISQWAAASSLSRPGSTNVVGALFLAFSTKGSFDALRRRSPEHWLFRLGRVAWVSTLVALVAVALLAGSGWLGYARGRTADRRASLRAELKKAAAVSAEVQAAKQPIIDVRSREVTTTQEAAEQYRRIAPAVAKWRSLLPKYKNAIEGIRLVAEDADAPVALHQQLEALQQVFELDSAEAEVIAKEVELGAAMEQLPAREQGAFYEANIRPLIEQENKIEARKDPLMRRIQQLEAEIVAQAK